MTDLALLAFGGGVRELFGLSSNVDMIVRSHSQIKLNMKGGFEEELLLKSANLQVHIKNSSKQAANDISD